MSSDPQDDKTAPGDPVRPQETLRDRLDRTIYDAAHYWPTPLGHDESADLADAVLPIVEEETARQLAALRDKVKTLADEWEHKAGGIEVDRITGMHLRNAVRRLRALVEEPQDGEQ